MDVSMPDIRDLNYMALALAQAQRAADSGEVPVGAVLVQPGPPGGTDRVLATAHNQPIGLSDPSAHAEMLALRAAALALGNYRLDGCELYVTLEPCAMCAQALLHARIARVVYGAREPKTGAAGSVIDVLGNPLLNHQTQVTGGVRADECAALMRSFFAAQRDQARLACTPLRDDALRTPDARFEPVWRALPEGVFHHRWHRGGAALAGLQMHWLEYLPAGHPASSTVLVALHDPDAWCPQWADWAQSQQAAGFRVVLPDLIGFGQSDKPKKARWHTLAQHADVLSEWLQAVGGSPWRIAAPPAQQPLAQAVQQALMYRICGAEVAIESLMPTAPESLPADWRELPYPDPGHRAAIKAWPWPAR